jgi:hypothetical protein
MYRTHQYDDENNLSEAADDRNVVHFYIKVKNVSKTKATQ